MDVNGAIWRKSSRSGGNGGNCVELADLTWRKSSRSGGNGGHCVELSDLTWRKSAHSAGNGGDCVELADLTGTIGIRDSKNPAGGHLTLSRRHVAELVDRIKSGELDL